jgi:hypothetical protein
VPEGEEWYDGESYGGLDELLAQDEANAHATRRNATAAAVYTLRILSARHLKGTRGPRDKHVCMEWMPRVSGGSLRGRWLRERRPTVNVLGGLELYVGPLTAHHVTAPCECRRGEAGPTLPHVKKYVERYCKLFGDEEYRAGRGRWSRRHRE